MKNLIINDLKKAFKAAEKEVFLMIRHDRKRKVCKGCSYLKRCVKEDFYAQLGTKKVPVTQDNCKHGRDFCDYMRTHPEAQREYNNFSGG